MILKVLIILLGMCSVATAESFYYFSGPNCAPCVTFYKTILLDKEVAGLIRKFDAALKIDTQTHPNIAKYYRVKSIPTIIIVRREEKYQIQDSITGNVDAQAGINRITTVRPIAIWPKIGTNLTNKQEFIKFLKDNLKTQEDGQTENTPNIIRKF